MQAIRKNQRDLRMTGDNRRTLFGDPCPQKYTEFALQVNSRLRLHVYQPLRIDNMELYSLKIPIE